MAKTNSKKAPKAPAKPKAKTGKGKEPQPTPEANGEPAGGKGKEETAAPAAGGRLSALDAAALLVAEEPGKTFTPLELVRLAAGRGLWTSPNGKTPEATLRVAIAREIASKGALARGRYAGKGLVAANG